MSAPALRLVKSDEQLVPHPAATLFPMLPREELEALAEDIRANGQHDPIVILDGKILDGRNRLAACVLAGVTPRFETLAACEWPIAYVLSRNLRRRHLTAVERATIAASPEVLGEYRAAAAARKADGQRRGGETRMLPGQSNREAKSTEAIVEAARAVGAGEANAKRMDRVRREAPEVFERARAGEFATVNDAVRAAGIEVKPRPPEPPQPPPVTESRVDPRTVRRIENDAKIADLLAQGHNQAETARILGLSPNTVSDAALRVGAKNPLAGPLSIVKEAGDSLRTMTEMFKPQWDSASEPQRKELLQHLETLIGASRAFMNRVKKGA